MKQFKTKNITILVATDVASRGIDVDDISPVIHYQLQMIMGCIRTSGRTGRAGKTGTSIALVGGMIQTCSDRRPLSAGWNERWFLRVKK